MGLQTTDFFAISRAGTNYKVSAQDILAYMNENVGTSQFDVPNIAARNALTGLSTGDRVFVTDATGDATVSSGWAIYLYRPGPAWTKVAEQEAMDVLAGTITNLSYVAGVGSGIVVSSDGNDATIPAVDSTNAGLALPSHKAKLDFLTVTNAIDLDSMKVKSDYLTITAATNIDVMRAASHAAVTTVGNAQTNPIVATGQALSFDITGLTSAP